MTERDGDDDTGAGTAASGEAAPEEAPSGEGASGEGAFGGVVPGRLPAALDRLLFRGPVRHEAPAPLEGPVVGTLVVGTAVWCVLFLAQLPFYGWFESHGHAWWVWTCLVGTGGGLFGTWYTRRREAALRRRADGDGATAGDGNGLSGTQAPAGPSAE